MSRSQGLEKVVDTSIPKMYALTIFESSMSYNIGDNYAPSRPMSK